MLNLIHELTYIGRNGVHAQCVQTTVKHVGLDSYFIKRLCECADGLVGVLTVQKIDLLHGTAVSLNAVKAAHIDDYRSNLGQLVLAGHILA